MNTSTYPVQISVTGRVVQIQSDHNQLLPIYNEGGDAIALSVLKAGKKVDGVGVNNRCDAITGATLTSNGVNDMLHDSLKKYMKFLKNNAK